MSDKAWATLIAAAGVGLMLCLAVAPIVLGTYNVELALFDTTDAAVPMLCATVGFGLVVRYRWVVERTRDARSKKQRDAVRPADVPRSAGSRSMRLLRGARGVLTLAAWTAPTGRSASSKPSRS
jgi:hypothetical protein